jgi:hypothetical protein
LEKVSPLLPIVDATPRGNKYFMMPLLLKRGWSNYSHLKKVLNELLGGIIPATKKMKFSQILDFVNETPTSTLMDHRFLILCAELMLGSIEKNVRKWRIDSRMLYIGPRLGTKCRVPFPFLNNL